MQTRRLFFVALMGSLMLTACNFAPAPQGGATPTLEEITQAVEPTTVPTATPSPTLEPVTEVPIIVETSTPIPTPEAPTMPPAPTETPGPFEHTIAEGETLGFIVQLYGHRSYDVFREVVNINANVPNADVLPGAGSVILIPRPTATATPEGLELTPTIAPDAAVQPTEADTGLVSGAPLNEYIVIEGDSIVTIAVNNATTLDVLARLNPDVPFFGCNFEIPSGGPNCNPPLSIGQVLRVPAPTPTPTLSPTPSGNETATATPTYIAPIVVSPPQDALVPAGLLRLEWVSVGILREDEVYLVQLEDTLTGNQHIDITRNTSLLLPATLIPNTGQDHVFHWSVAVARPDANGVYGVVGGEPAVRRFRWQSR